MVMAKRILNFVQGGDALAARLPIPEHDETLAADTAVGFGVSLRGLAEYLHVGTSKWGEGFLAQNETILRFREWENSSLDARTWDFRGRLQSSFRVRNGKVRSTLRP